MSYNQKLFSRAEEKVFDIVFKDKIDLINRLPEFMFEQELNFAISEFVKKCNDSDRYSYYSIYEEEIKAYLEGTVEKHTNCMQESMKPIKVAVYSEQDEKDIKDICIECRGCDKVILSMENYSDFLDELSIEIEED